MILYRRKIYFISNSIYLSRIYIVKEMSLRHRCIDSWKNLLKIISNDRMNTLLSNLTPHVRFVDWTNGLKKCCISFKNVKADIFILVTRYFNYFIVRSSFMMKISDFLNTSITLRLQFCRKLHFLLEKTSFSIVDKVSRSPNYKLVWTFKLTHEINKILRKYEKSI